MLYIFRQTTRRTTFDSRLTGAREDPTHPSTPFPYPRHRHTTLPFFVNPTGSKFSYIYDWLVNAMDVISLSPCCHWFFVFSIPHGNTHLRFYETIVYNCGVCFCIHRRPAMIAKPTNAECFHKEKKNYLPFGMPIESKL